MKEQLKKYGVIVLGILLIVVGIVFQSKEPEETLSIDLNENTSNEQKVEISYIYVDIKGAVNNPGVYKLEQSSRLFQLIDLAGGLIEEADGNALNFSIILADQDVVYIPTVEEEFPSVLEETGEDIGGIININTADQTTLETLPGIGPATAQNIIDYRREYGNFGMIEDIMNVSGIGEATFNEIKSLITI